MKLKVLPPESWMLSKRALESSIQHRETRPVRFNRPGIYMEGGQCWFEAAGQSWWYSPMQFKFELASLHAQTLDHRKVQALKSVVEQRLATKGQRELYSACLYVEEFRRDERRYTLSKLKSNLDKEKP